MNARRVDRIQLLLELAFEPESLQVDDDSHKHVGHEGEKVVSVISAFRSSVHISMV